MINVFERITAALAVGVLTAALFVPASAQNISADVSIGGSGGVNASVGTSSNDSSGTNAGVNASIGGPSGVNANVGTSSNNSSGTNVGVNASIGGSGGINASVGSSTANPNSPGVNNPGLNGVINRMSAEELQLTRMRCVQILASPASYDSDLVTLCRLVNVASR